MSGYFRFKKLNLARRYTSFKRRGAWHRGGQIFGKPRTDEGDYEKERLAQLYGQGAGRWDMDTEDREDTAEGFYRQRGGHKSWRDEWNS